MRMTLWVARAGFLLTLVGVSACESGPPPTGLEAPSPAVDAIGLAELTRLDHLARFKRSVKVGAFSSYDRTGGNDDGFSGAYSFIRQDAEGLVLAELDGPGAIYRIWTPTPTDDVFAFYFDGEDEPRLEIPFRQLFTGEREPFVSPIVGYGAGGFYCYLPITFERSIKIVARAETLQFYQINYALYPDDVELGTFDGYAAPESRALLATAVELFEAAGEDVSASAAPAGVELLTERTSVSLAPASSVTLFETDQGGRIAGLRLGPASAFAGKVRDVIIRIFWDGDEQPAVLSPVGDLFGYSWGDPAMRSVVAGTAGDTNYLYLPMPFDESARIELTSERAEGPPLDVEVEVVWTRIPREPDEGRFYALWRRENPTIDGEPFTFLDTQGRGHIVGAVLQAQGFESAQTGFFEGDDQAILDGELVIHGTGSEDFFNGGWYNVTGRWMSRVSLPLSGCLDYNNALGRSAGYRFMLTDAYAFRTSARLTIEHAPTENRLPTDYASVVYFYSEERPTMAFELPGEAERRVSGPDRILFRPGWSVPIDSFSFRGMTVTKVQEPIDGVDTRYLEVRVEGEDVFGPHSVGFRCELPEAGTYAVSIEALGGPDQATVQLFRNERAEGQAVDLFREARQPVGPLRLAELEFAEGENAVLLKLSGTNDRSSGQGVDLTGLVFERVP
ncbi:MAG: hypothetical protein CL476_09005 [Acidobacteria bacterium]|nr:hypothetical protein [Acidobacteriota bacterium]